MRVCLLVMLMASSLVCAQQVDSVPPATETAQLDEILVTGEQPGPGLWKVTKGGHTLWILGTHGPLPEKMTWRSREVESIIAESGRVVKWVTIDTDVDIGFFAGLAALPSAITAGNNPDDAKLKDVVTPAAYQQWLVLKEKYMGHDNSVEKLRPSFAAMELRSKAIDKAGLSSKPVIWPAVQRIAKKHKVKILEPEVKMHIKVDQPRATIKKFKKTAIADAECFSQSLARLETDIDSMRQRANAWSIGNVDALRKIPPPDPASDCVQMLTDAMLKGQLADEMGAREMMDRTVKEIARVDQSRRELWVKTVDETLRDQSVVFAVVPMEVLLNEHGPLEALRANGYEISEP